MSRGEGPPPPFDGDPGPGDDDVLEPWTGGPEDVLALGALQPSVTAAPANANGTAPAKAGTARESGEGGVNTVRLRSQAGPVMPLAANHGPLGAAARTIEPLSEADPAAVLVQLLVAFGNAVGRGPRVVLGSVRQWANLFAVVVGKSSKARKGTSWENTAEVIGGADEQWAASRIQSGLSSGEGLIHAVRDPVVKQQPIRRGGRSNSVVEYEGVQEDPGVADKRLLVVEGEFARVLKVAARKDNVLSAVLRSAWDSGNLSVLTKQAYRATGAHLSAIGHITMQELRRELSICDSLNGFANRFLWVYARRSQELPFGEKRIGEAAADLTAGLGSALRTTLARGDHEVGMDALCRERWGGIYSRLSADRPGLAGSVLNRAEAQVLRMALVYALADAEDTIRLPHLEAAQAVWSYCEESARLIFGNSLGDPVADKILAALRESPEGVTREELGNYFHHNHAAARIEQALGLLVENGLAHGRKDARADGRGGRPAERWFASPPQHAGNAENGQTGTPEDTNPVNPVNRVEEQEAEGNCT